MLRVDQAVDQLGECIDQRAHGQQAAEKQQAGGQYAAPFGPHQARKATEQEPDQLRTQRAAMAIELLVAAHRQLLQLLDQVAAVTACLR